MNMDEVGNLYYYDTHAHYGQNYRKTSFYERRHEILAEAYRAGIRKIVNVAISMESNLLMLEDFKEYPIKAEDDCHRLQLPQIRIALGEHPNCVGKEEDAGQDWEKDQKLKELCAHPRVCAIKTGLDYSKGTNNRKRQQLRFRKLIGMSREQNLPLILHIRDAYEDALGILEEEAEGIAYKGVVHCFTQGPDMAWRFIEKGFLLGIGGKVTYGKITLLRECVKEIPLKYMVLETDSPFIPLCGSKEVNTSLDIPVIAQMIAELKEIDVREVAEVTSRNAEQLF